MKKTRKSAISILLIVCMSFMSVVSFAADVDGSVAGATIVNTDFESLAPGAYPMSKIISDTNLVCHQSEVTVSEEDGNKFVSSDCTIQRGLIVGSLKSIQYDNLVLEFSFRISDSDCQFQSVIRSGSGGKYDLKPFNIESGGKIKYLSTSDTQKADYNVWYDVAVLCKASPNEDGTFSKTFAVFIKEDGEYVLKSQQTDSKSDPEKDSISAIGLWASQIANSTSRIDFDNIRVYTEKYTHDAKFLLEGDRERLESEVGIDTAAYEVDNDAMTISLTSGIKTEAFIGDIENDVTGKIVSILSAEGEECETITNGSVLTISSHNGENILQYTLVVENLPPEAELILEEKADADNFIIRVKAVDDMAVDRVEIFINDEYAGDSEKVSGDMYELWYAPEYLGVHSVRAVAYDEEDKSDSASGSVILTRTSVNRTTLIDFDENESKFYQSGGFGTGVNESTSGAVTAVDSSHGKSYGANVTTTSGKGSTGPWVALDVRKAKRAVISYDIYLKGEGLSTAAFIRDRSNSPEVVNQMPQFLDGVLNIFDGSQTLTLELDAFKWYTLSTEINNITDSYSLLITSGDEEIAYYDELSLAKNADVITDMRICFSGGADGMIALDNLSVDVIGEMPYVSGISADGTSISGKIDYTSSSVYLKIPSGFTLSDNQDIVKLTCADGEVKIKEMSSYGDGTWLCITPDYLESQGFEPHTDYEVVINESFLAADGKNETGMPLRAKFVTTDRPFEAVKTSFTKSNGVTFNATFENETSDAKEVLIILTAYENNLFVKSAFKKVTVESGTHTASVNIADVKSGTVCKARIVNPDNLTFTNRIYEHIIK